MRIPRMRFTMKRIMLAVAVLALIMGGLRIAWLRDSYRKSAAYYAATEKMQRDLRRLVEEAGEAEDELAVVFGYKVSGEDKERQVADLQAMQRMADYYVALRRKYERAAARPWIPVDPDPPPPQS